MRFFGGYLLCLFCVFDCAFGFNGFSDLYNRHEEPHSESDDFKSEIKFMIKEKWIEQKLDHFNADDKRTWKMRYLENDRFFKPGGPVLIFIGGEWQITSGLITTGLLHEIAHELNGTLFYTEHRYYGKSRPTADTSAENLKFLTVSQAVADLAHFVEFMKASSSDNFTSSGVILVGSSYSATLATWTRLKHPDLVNGVWSSSAPLLAKADFYEYNEVLTQSLRAVGGEKCLSRFESAFKQLEGFLAFSEPKVLAKIEKDFNLCEPLSLRRDIGFFFYELLDAISGLVQKHKSGSIEKACEFIVRDMHSDDVAAFGSWLVSQSTKKCEDMNYDHTVTQFLNVTWGSRANQQLRQWTYQQCDTFGWFQTVNSSAQLLGVKYPMVRYYLKLCSDLFGRSYNWAAMERSVQKTNEEFGGLTPKVTNVYFTHGQLDPWRSMGIQKDLNPNCPVVILENYSHTADLYSITETDTLQMVESKNRVKQLVRKWLKIQ